MAQQRGRGQAKAERPIGQVKGRQGGRWYNEKPTSEEVAQWFKDNVKLHEDLEHDRYVGGLTLISQTEYIQEVVEQSGREVIQKVKNLVYTPYSKVESRVQYFWDLMLKHPEWEGRIEPVDPIAKDKDRDGDLPKGFYRTSVKLNNTVYPYIACCMKVSVVARNTQQHNGIILAPPATKMVPMLGEDYNGNAKIDPYVLMKAETGAVGRALGMAGMLIIPGAGVATAEDMLEAQAQGEVGSGEVESVVTATGASEEGEEVKTADAAEVLVKEAESLLSRLKAEKSDAHQKFQEWAKGRGFGPLSSLTEVQLRGIVKKLQKEFE